MKTFQLDENGDRIITGGQIVMITDKECLAQRLKNSIRLNKYSWFLDTDKGIEWPDILGFKSVSTRVIYSRVLNILESDSEVSSVNSIDITADRSERAMSITFSVNSIYGEVTGTV